MTFTSLIYAAVFVLLSFALLVWHFWPRHEDGKPYSPDEIEDLVKRLPTHREGGNGARVMLVIISFIAVLAVALTSSKANHHDTNHFND